MYRFIFFCFLLCIGCSEAEPFQFAGIPCDPDEMPLFDVNKVTLLDSNRQPWKDTIISQIEKRRTVFKPCRELTYKAIFRTRKGKIISDSRIRMMATGKRWEIQPEKQDEIIVQYEFHENEADKILKSQINKALERDRWFDQIVEGVVENADEIWMHPFRMNQYNFTEVAPFPEIKFPLKQGKTWTGQLRLIDGWGDWDNTSGNMKYEVESRESISTKYGAIEDCWKIKSKATYPFGDSFLDYWFSEDLGFVKLDYTNYGGQTLSIQLEKVNTN